MNIPNESTQIFQKKKKEKKRKKSNVYSYVNCKQSINENSTYKRVYVCKVYAMHLLLVSLAYSYLKEQHTDAHIFSYGKRKCNKNVITLR